MRDPGAEVVGAFPGRFRADRGEGHRRDRPGPVVADPAILNFRYVRPEVRRRPRAT